MVRPLTSFQAPDVVVDVTGEISLKVVAPVGPRGPEGPPGKSVLYGDGSPDATVGANGDFYIDTEVFEIYGPKASAAWPVGVPLVGPRGAPGDNGAPGVGELSVLSGNGAPDSTLALDRTL
jgi:hypothetical protein